MAIPPLAATYSATTPLAIGGEVSIIRFFPSITQTYSSQGLATITIDISTDQYIDPRNSYLEFTVNMTQPGSSAIVGLVGGAYCFFYRHRVLGASQQLYAIDAYNLLHKILDTWTTSRDQATGEDAIFGGKSSCDAAHFQANDPNAPLTVTTTLNAGSTFETYWVALGASSSNLVLVNAATAAVSTNGVASAAICFSEGFNASKFCCGGVRTVGTTKSIYRIQLINPLFASDKLLPCSEMGLFRLELQLAPQTQCTYQAVAINSPYYEITAVSYVAHCVKVDPIFAQRIAMLAATSGIRLDVPAWGELQYVVPNGTSQNLQIITQVSSLEAVLAVPRPAAFAIGGASVNPLRSSVWGLTSSWFQVNGRNYPTMPGNYTLPAADDVLAFGYRNPKVELFTDLLKVFDKCGRRQLNTVLDYSNYQDPHGMIGMCFERFVGESQVRLVGINTRTAQTIIYLYTNWVSAAVPGIHYATDVDSFNGNDAAKAGVYFSLTSPYKTQALNNLGAGASVRWDVFYRYLTRILIRGGTMEFQI